MPLLVRCEQVFVDALVQVVECVGHRAAQVVLTSLMAAAQLGLRRLVALPCTVEVNVGGLAQLALGSLLLAGQFTGLCV
jgi:hypothetical protein